MASTVPWPDIFPGSLSDASYRAYLDNLVTTYLSFPEDQAAPVQAQDVKDTLMNWSGLAAQPADELMEQAQYVATFKAGLATLTPEQAAAFEGRLLQKPAQSIARLAAVLGLRSTQIGSLTKEARNRLHTYMQSRRLQEKQRPRLRRFELWYESRFQVKGNETKAEAAYKRFVTARRLAYPKFRQYVLANIVQYCIATRKSQRWVRYEWPAEWTRSAEYDWVTSAEFKQAFITAWQRMLAAL